MEKPTLNLVQDLTFKEQATTNGNLGLNAKFTGVLKSINVNAKQDIKGSESKFYPATIDIYQDGADTKDPNAKVLTGVQATVYHNNAFDKEGNQRMQVGETYAGEITQPIDTVTKQPKAGIKPWISLSHLTAIGNRIDTLVFGAPAQPQVQQAQADLSQVS